ncbi:xanthine dehydrogenase family protein molybdopterin-binding subunit [Desulfogranum japonicum]|uniref:xanthine dehydrogenase family protein molybdopterin-binding subunit n=1 Tax=Desulfogranum japonicum TaxID=231447 RepID=UPI000402A617|nr:xanthine dehydrogenase family protein molybdopterin-binding subunit [Desulfogranum japonicum]
MDKAMTRRSFLKTGSLVIAAATVANSTELFNASQVYGSAEMPFKPHAFLEIRADDTVVVWVGQTNLGQGTHTGLAMVIADELDASWGNVQVKMALAADPFKDPVWHAQLTGGSTSFRHRWDLLRSVGAAARQMLLEAAAQQWGLNAGECKASEGKIIHPDGRSLRYGQLVETAGKRAVPVNPQLKNPAAHTIIGTQKARLDIPDKVQGKTVYGFDFTLPGMCVAVVARPPRYGAVPEAYNADAAMAVKGVIKVIPLEERIAVCAENTYAAMRGRNALDLKWSEGSHPNLSDEMIAAVFTDSLKKKGADAGKKGGVDQALATASQTLQQEYSLPYLSHGQVEPINCTAHVEKDRCRIWIPTQMQTATQMTASSLTGLPIENVEVMTLPAGGGFGLRGEQDPVVDSVLLSQALDRPVKVIWTREDDFIHGYFRPANRSRVQAGLDEHGQIICWDHTIAAPSVMSRVMPHAVVDGIDPDAVSGVSDMVYTFANHAVHYVMVNLPVTVGWWRSVGFSSNIFAVESFMDELAHAAGKDPVLFRLAHMEKGSRSYDVLALLAEKGGWNTPVPAGRARGVAVSACFESFAAHMAEVSVGENGNVKVHRVVCALDCGTAIYPDAIKAQAEAGVVMGLSAAFHEQVSFAKGGVKTANYDDYPVLTMSDVPEVEVFIAKNDFKAGGVGEPVLPSVAPAVANAIFKASGIRLRELPFRKDLLKQG